MKPFKKKRYEKRFFLTLFIVILTLFAIMGLYNTGKKKNFIGTELAEVTLSAKPDPQTPDQLSVASGIVYRHLVAYNLVCTESGQPLTKYPAYFSNKYQAEIRRIDEAWARRGKSLEAVLTDYDSRRYPKLAPEIQTELLDMERKVAIIIKAQNAETTPDKINWTQADENKLNLKDACLLFDDAAPEMGEKTNFATVFKQVMHGL